MNAITQQRKRLLPAGRQDLANDVISGGEIRELIVAAGISDRARLGSLEHLVIVQIDVNGSAGKGGVVALPEPIGVEVVKEIAGDRCARRRLFLPEVFVAEILSGRKRQVNAVAKKRNRLAPAVGKDLP